MKELAATVHEFLSLFYSKLYAEISNFLIIGLQRFKLFLQMSWYICFTELDGSMESFITKNRHQTWNKDGFDTSFFTVTDPFKVFLVIVKELCNNYVSSSFNFLFQMLDVILSTNCLTVNLWITCYNHAEEVLIPFFDECYELSSVGESIFYWYPVFNTHWWVTSQS